MSILGKGLIKKSKVETGLLNFWGQFKDGDLEAPDEMLGKRGIEANKIR